MKETSLLLALKEQKEIKLKGNLYHVTQIQFAYNSNRIEGSSLTEEETRMMYETNTLLNENKPTRIKDVIETANHFYLFDYMLDEADKSIDEYMIKEFHKLLKRGTSDERKDWFKVGDYKALPNEVGGKETARPEDVEKEVQKLLGWYNNINNVKIEDIVEFHYKFEIIHPFQDRESGELVGL